MADTRTTIRIDSVGADKVKRDFIEITAANDKAAAGFQKTGTAAGTAAGGLDKLGATTKGYAVHAEVASKSSSMLGVGLAALSGAAAIAAGVGVLAGALKGVVGALDDLGDQAQKLGLTTTALQELQDAARRSDADVASLNGSWEKFTKAVGEATQGSGKLNDILKQYNIGLKNSDGSTRSTMALYLDLADAARKTGDSTEIARLAVAMFGKEGIALAPMLAKGADGFREMAKEAHKAGRIVSEDLVEAAGEMQATYDRMLDTLTAKWRSFAVTAAAVIGLIDVPLKMQLREQLAATKEQLRAMDFVLERQKRGSTADIEAHDKYNRNLEVRAQLLAKIELLEKNIAAPSLKPSKPNFIAPESDGDAAKAAAALEKANKAAAAAIHDRMMMESDERLLAEKLTDAYFKQAGGINEVNKKREAADQNINDAIAAIEQETILIGLSNDERERTIALLDLEKDGASEAQKARLKQALAGKQTAEAAKKAADEIEAIWDSARESFSDSWSDLFYGIFNDGKFKFGDFAKSLKSIWARTLADMLTMSIQDSIIKPMFDGLMGGAGSGTGSGGSRNVFGSLGASLFGGGSSDKAGSASWMKENVYGPSGNGGSGGGFFDKGGTGSEILGGAAAGAGIGSMIGGKASTILGAAGGAIGSMFGPIGKIIGSVIGSVVGLAFQTTPKSISSYGTGGVGDSMASGGLDVKIGKDMAKGVVRALKTFSEQLVTGIESDEFLGIVGQRGKKFFYQAQETELKVAGKKRYGAVKFDSAEEAIAAAIEAAINSGVVKGLTDADKKLMRAATSVQEAMADVVASHNFKRELGFQFIGLTSPLAEAKARLEFEYQQQLMLAEKYEADKTQLEAVYAQKRLDLVEQFNSQQYASLKSFLTSITAGSSSPLSPTTRLGLAQANYSTLAQKAKAGDEGAIAALQGAAQDYLSAGKDVFASSSGFQSIYQQVVGDLSAITGVANPLGVGAAANQNVAAAVNDNTRYQAQWFTQAATQRESTNTKLDTLITLMAPVASALNRGAATPTQNGTVNVGTIDWAGISQAVASIR